MRILLALPIVVLAGCLASRIQSMQSQGTDSQSSASRFDPAQRLSPTAFEQNATMKDTSVHEDPNLLKVGVPRSKITAAFGTPNQISNEGGREEDVYEFNPDGSKFVKPKVYARNIAAGVFTGGIATVVQLLNSGQQKPLLRVNGDQISWSALEATLRRHFQKGDEKVILLKADEQLPFGQVVQVIDTCRATGAKVVVDTPAL